MNASSLARRSRTPLLSGRNQVTGGNTSCGWGAFPRRIAISATTTPMWRQVQRTIPVSTTVETAVKTPLIYRRFALGDKLCNIRCSRNRRSRLPSLMPIPDSPLHRLVITGDDFGRNAEVNEAVEIYHRAGALDQAS